MGNDCLGTHFKDGTAKLYFSSGIKKKLEIQLREINSYLPIKWKWKKQFRVGL